MMLTLVGFQLPRFCFVCSLLAEMVGFALSPKIAANVLGIAEGGDF